MANFTLVREGNVFKGFKKTSFNDVSKMVFCVNGAEAARAAVRFFKIVTPIQNYFFDNPSGSRLYNVSDDPRDPYLGTTDGL